MLQVLERQNLRQKTMTAKQRPIHVEGNENVTAVSDQVSDYIFRPGGLQSMCVRLCRCRACELPDM